MIHLFEILILFLCFGVVIYFYKKISAQPENKSIAIFSTVIGLVSIITISVAYLWVFYNHNIDWSFLRVDWQEVNSKGWNDINYIERKVGSIIFLISAIINPLIAIFAIGYSLSYSMKEILQPENQINILLVFIIPVLISIATNIGLSNILARIIRKAYRKIKGS